MTLASRVGRGRIDRASKIVLMAKRKIFTLENIMRMNQENLESARESLAKAEYELNLEKMAFRQADIES